jgi:hypothetical protein
MTKHGWMAATVLITTGILAAAIGVLYSKGSADLIGTDEQPLRFSHEVHAGRLNVECLYCHRSAGQSSTAGIPSMQLCMGCHQNLAVETKDTAALVEHWRQRTPVSWVRLQRLPDFVYFTHERHLAHGFH